MRLIGVVLGENIFLVTEFMGKGNLVEYLRSRGRSVITKKDQINFATYGYFSSLMHVDILYRHKSCSYILSPVIRWQVRKFLKVYMQYILRNPRIFISENFRTINLVLRCLCYLYPPE